jgi:hypothetical protein
VIYIINSHSDYYKIGRTKDVVKRMRMLQSGCPFRLKLVYKTKFNCQWIEAYLHSICRKERTCGEWFKLRKCDLKWIKFVLKEYDKFLVKNKIINSVSFMKEKEFNDFKDILCKKIKRKLG